MKRKMASSMKPLLEYTQDGDKFTIKGGPKELTFTVGDEVEDELPNGKPAKVCDISYSVLIICHYV